jgi:hypothetical protein
MRERDYLFIASAVAQYKNGARTAAGLARRGVEAGVPDLLILEKPPGRRKGILAVELKVGKNKLSHKQAEWLDRAAERGHATAIVYTLTEFKAAVQAHLYPGSGAAAQPVVLEE